MQNTAFFQAIMLTSSVFISSFIQMTFLQAHWLLLITRHKARLYKLKQEQCRFGAEKMKEVKRYRELPGLVQDGRRAGPDCFSDLLTPSNNPVAALHRQGSDWWNLSVTFKTCPRQLNPDKC